MAATASTTAITPEPTIKENLRSRTAVGGLSGSKISWLKAMTFPSSLESHRRLHEQRAPNPQPTASSCTVLVPVL